MTLPLKSLKRLIKVHDKLQEWHGARLARLQQELEELDRAEIELIETFDRVSAIANLPSLGFLRRLNNIRSKKSAVSKAIVEARAKLAKVMATQNWLAEERVHRTEQIDQELTQNQIDEWLDAKAGERAS